MARPARSHVRAGPGHDVSRPDRDFRAAAAPRGPSRSGPGLAVRLGPLSAGAADGHRQCPDRLDRPRRQHLDAPTHALAHMAKERDYPQPAGYKLVRLQSRKCPGERAEGRVVVARVPSECPGLPDETSPPQVSTIEGVSRPVGRVLCARSRGPAVIHLGLPLPAASCGLPASIGRAALDRSRRERRSPLDLAPGGVYRAAAVTCGAGGLLHHRFTLAPAAAEAVCFLWHCPAGRPGSALPTTLSCGARTFLTGLAPGATARPTHPQLRIRAPPGQPTEPVPPRIGHPLVLRDFFLPNGR